MTEFECRAGSTRTAVRKIVRSHAVNELYGAQVFDEPAIALAPTPYAKWLTCRVAMEEYGHHVRFRELGEQMGIPEEEMTPSGQEAALDLRVPARGPGRNSASSSCWPTSPRSCRSRISCTAASIRCATSRA